MRCLFSLALGLFALEAALALDPAAISSAEAICPEPSSSEMSCAQAQACVTNRDCLGDAICCPSACGRSCSTPIYKAQKTRNCPWVQAALAPKECQVQDQCVKDNDCSANERCCFNGCAMRCTNADTEKPSQ